MKIQSIVNKITTEVLNPLIVLLFAVATAVFVWGIVMYVIGGAGSAQKVETARRVIVYGIIGMFIMAFAWGIVRILCNFFGATTPCI